MQSRRGDIYTSLYQSGRECGTRKTRARISRKREREREGVQERAEKSERFSLPERVSLETR